MQQQRVHHVVLRPHLHPVHFQTVAELHLSPAVVADVSEQLSGCFQIAAEQVVRLVGQEQVVSN